jgi:hypothetical protein
MTDVHADADAPPAVPTGPFWARSEVRPVLWLVAAHLIGAIVIGLTWLAWAPKTVAFVVPGDGTSTIVIPDESENQVAGDARFLILSAVAAVLLAVLAWRMRSIRGPLSLVVLAVGGLLSSGLAVVLGSTLASGQSSSAARATIHPPLGLHATSMFWAQAFLAVLVYMVLAGLSADPRLGRADEPSSSSNPDLPETLPPWPEPPATD